MTISILTGLLLGVLTATVISIHETLTGRKHRALVLYGACLLGTLAWSASAHAATLFVVAEQAPHRQVPNPHQFNAIIGYPDQCVTGIRCWTYTKGTRSPVGSYPESWYLHWDGVRVKDKVYHLYVMDPRSRGWRRHVATVCGQRCFLDGMGGSSLDRNTPYVPWTETRWDKYTARIVLAVVARGKRALPNSVGPDPVAGQQLVDAAGRGSTEAFNTTNAQAYLSMGRMWVAERGGCLDKYNAYLTYRGRGDHFSCYEQGTRPWDTSWLP